MQRFPDNIFQFALLFLVIRFAFSFSALGKAHQMLKRVREHQGHGCPNRVSVNNHLRTSVPIALRTCAMLSCFSAHICP